MNKRITFKLEIQADDESDILSLLVYAIEKMKAGHAAGTYTTEKGNYFYHLQQRGDMKEKRVDAGVIKERIFPAGPKQ